MSEIVLATGYLSNLIQTYFGDGSSLGVKISYSCEESALGTVGPLGSIDGLDETFILMNGDVLTTAFFPELLAAHKASGATATIASRLQTVDVDYGVLALNASGENSLPRIERIDEKPRYSWPVSMGIYVFEPRVLDFVPRDVKFDFPELISRLIEADEPVAAYEHDGYWMDIGQLHHLEAAVRDYEGDAEAFAHADQLRMLDALMADQSTDGNAAV